VWNITNSRQTTDVTTAETSASIAATGIVERQFLRTRRIREFGGDVSIGPERDFRDVSEKVVVRRINKRRKNPVVYEHARIYLCTGIRRPFN